jgi:hypothetical protein
VSLCAPAPPRFTPSPRNLPDIFPILRYNELDRLTEEADLLMLRKAHAAALLRWRGHAIPPAEKL